MADNDGQPEQKSPKAQESASAQTGILPPQHWTAHISHAAYEAGTAGGASAGADDDDDRDSALGDDDASSTASLTSSILRYRTIHGRTFHSERGNAQYCHHALTLAIDGKLYLSPLQRDKIKVSLLPSDRTVPGSEIEDCTQSWTFPLAHFDYIHMRWLVGSIDDWYRLFQQSFDALAPGGWLESYEMSTMWHSDDGSVTEHTALGQWGKIYIEGGRQSGRTFTVLDDELQRKAMEAAGFVDIQERNIKQPIGRWPRDPRLKEIGEFTQLTLEQDAEGYLLFIANTLGWTREQIMVYLAIFKREVRSGLYQPYYRQKVVWGRKPE
ncbi:hypothetical protein NEMBOFW57_006425 [Staphylotrichum longicolle]|uniref:Methyltransferase n=1 Tax=Staphylotrichum longicolle TaxID=669026 RepID=A0AAD4ETJ3_9PEZI|nr:hypothetical protein NEMBOFW57_006425 [Staphylotrichum longicolle]